MIFLVKKSVLDGARFSFYSIGKLEYDTMFSWKIDLS